MVLVQKSDPAEGWHLDLAQAFGQAGLTGQMGQIVKTFGNSGI
jgi:hypothetical protein